MSARDSVRVTDKVRVQLYQGGRLVGPSRAKRVLKWILWAIVAWLPFDLSLQWLTGWAAFDWQTWFMILPVTWILVVDFIRRKW